MVLASPSGMHQGALAAWQDHVPSHSALDHDSPGDTSVIVSSGQGLPYSCEHSPARQGACFSASCTGLSLWAIPSVTKLVAWAFLQKRTLFFFVWTSVGQVRDVLMGPAAFHHLSPCIREQM